MTFELAADAVVTGDVNTLGKLLAEYPELPRTRSERQHHATLLHYLGANGVEPKRQVSPPNVADIARVLLDAGAEVDALSDIYGRTTTLNLIASSAHPRSAGVQIPLMELLLAHGADIDGASGTPPVLAALRNGHSHAAGFLAEHGASLDIEAAAGLGRIDLLQSHFASNSPAQPGAAKAPLERGFLWACEYGHTQMIQLLLERGADLSADGGTGLQALHWAVVGGSLEAVDLLVKAGAPLEAANRHGATPLGQALWSALNGDSATGYLPVIRKLLQSGATVENDLLEWLSKQQGRSPSDVEQLRETLLAYKQIGR